MWKRWVCAVAMVLVAGVAGATVETDSRTQSFAPSSPTTVFTITFPFVAKNQITVTKTTIATSETVTLVQGVDYTVTLPIGTAKGFITTTVAVTDTHTLLVERLTPVTQETAFRAQGSYSARRHEEAFDKLTMIAQEIKAAAGTSGESAVTVHEGKADPHPQYAILDGRPGGQTLHGGDDGSTNLVLKSNPDENGLIQLGTGVFVNDVGEQLGISTPTPFWSLDVNGSAGFGSGTQVVLGSDSSPIVGTADDTDSLYLQTGIDADESEGVGIAIDGTADTIKLHTVSGEVVIGATDSPVDPWVTFSPTLVESEVPIQSPALIGGDGSGDGVIITSTSHATKGLATIGSGNNYIQLDEANGRAAVTNTGTGPSENGVLWHVRGVTKAYAYVSTACSETCADSGDGSPAACTTTGTLTACSLFAVQCQDADGCTITFDTTGMLSGTHFTAVNTGAVSWSLADTSGQRTAGTTLGTNDTATFVVLSGTIYQTGGSDN